MIPPSAIEVERAVIGAMLIEPKSIPTAVSMLDDETFFNQSHQRYFLAIRELHEQHIQVDCVTVVEMLKKQGKIEHEDPLTLTQLTMNVTTGANIEFHCYILIEKFIARKIIETATDYSKRCLLPEEDIFDILDGIGAEIRDLNLLRLGKFSPTKQIGHGVSGTVQLIDEMSKGIGKHVKKFYFGELDRFTGGMMNSDMIVIAGKDKRGKTSLALQIFLYNAMNGNPSGIFSQEMSLAQIQIRCATILAEINWLAFLERRISPADKLRFYEKFEYLKSLPIYVNDRMNSIYQIQDEAQRMKDVFNVELIGLDYIQLVKNETNGKNGTREQEVAAVSRGTKTMAKDLQLPVIAMCQLNKDMDSRESMAIQQDMDKMIKIDDKPFPAGVLRVSVDLEIRQRIGPSGNFGDVKLNYDIPTGSWIGSELTPPEENLF